MSVSPFSEQLLRDTVEDSLSVIEGERLLAALHQNPPMREDVLTLLAQFKVNLGPFFLRALLERLDSGPQQGDPVVDALRAALSLPAGELIDELLSERGSAR